jgi:hypothetical protein
MPPHREFVGAQMRSLALQAAKISQLVSQAVINATKAKSLDISAA